MLEAHNLTCVRDERVLFAQLSFTLCAGDVMQVEGENGAGKTSLLRILTGLSQPDAGDVRWQRQPLARCRADWHRALLWLGHQPGVKCSLTPLENLRFWFPQASAAARLQALDAVDLTGYETLPTGRLSAGQQRRVALARLWLTRATVWILDEPLTALDRYGIDRLLARLNSHRRQGGAVVITSHQPLPPLMEPVRRLTLAVQGTTI
ncbi:cytochrome c biogenesis heme-transporting ATPase CcmA [Pantoea sp. 1.19]|uniref:cytochrome c biogenesis heme-transporting ATPase CcmA n=1 Tax=Pantoea sp. 1.19 TaxID=1925589 RepID=UPI000948AFF1|nr:cytochrome c biogenesis heme-transporting ATPase CcmA [Pantoea sp. 1.19]